MAAWIWIIWSQCDCMVISLDETSAGTRRNSKVAEEEKSKAKAKSSARAIIEEPSRRT